MHLNDFFGALWNDYVAMAPQAAALKAAFERRGESVANDHVAFRTLDIAPLNIASLEGRLLALGYTRFEPYRFEAKKLDAWAYLPPDPSQPRVFLSELRVGELSEGAQAILRRLAAEATVPEGPEVFWSGRPWSAPSFAEYEALRAESEYAAWVAALGLRPNHFTIAIHQLEGFDSVEGVLQAVEEEGREVSDAGGRVKGSPAVFLEQGSTRADRMPVTFAGGETREIPTCYYEFALRHPMPNGELYQGFVATSADKIFESTNTRTEER